MDNRTSVALGYFDGLHLGHRAVIDAAVSGGHPTLLCTFPQGDTPPGHRMPWLMLPRQREVLLRSLGVSRTVEWGYSEIGGISPEGFVERLCRELDPAVIACGYNYRFGQDARGDVNTLRQLCDRKGIALRVTQPVIVDGAAVSSSRIRALLAEGRPAAAAKCLGRPFSFALPVVTGRQLGRKLHFPTINQAIPPQLQHPLFGVYVSGVLLHGVIHLGVTNLGIKPTVGSDAVLAETYIFDCDEDLYGHTLQVSLYDYIRPEQKFGSIDELQGAIARDVAYARAHGITARD